MKRLIVFISIVLAIVIVSFLAITRVADVVAAHLTQKLGVPVSIDSIEFSPQTIKLTEIQIGNVAHYFLPKAFSAKQVKIDAPLSRYLGKEVIIEEVLINDVYLGLEFDSTKGAKGNWTTILAQFKNNIAQSIEGKAPPTLLIKKLIVTNISTQLLFHDKEGTQTLPMIDRMEFTDVTSSGGIAIDQLTSSILGQMLRSIFTKEQLQNMLDPLLSPANKATDLLIKPFKLG